MRYFIVLLLVGMVLLGFYFLKFPQKGNENSTYNIKNKSDTNKYRLNNIKLHSFSNDTLFLKDIVTHKRLIFYFTEKTCLECVDNCLSIIKQLEENGISEKIIVIAYYDNILRRLYAKKASLQLEVDCYNALEKIHPPFNNRNDIHDISFFMIIDKNLNASAIKQCGTSDSISDLYFSRIIEIIHKNLHQ